MKEKIKTTIKYFLALGPAAIPLLGFAQTNNPSFDKGLNTIGSGAFPNQQGVATTLTVNGLIIQVITWLLEITGAIAVLFVIIGGFWYITSAGNAEQAEKGQKTLINAIIGVIIVVLSYVIISVVAQFVTNNVSGAN